MPPRKPAPTPKATTALYARLLRLLKGARIRFLIGGTCAINSYLRTKRDTKDLDIFCRAGDYPRILKLAAAHGYRTEVEDERWIAKIFLGQAYCDVIFGSANMVAPVGDTWFREAHPARIMNTPVRLLPPTELVWSKSFIMDRYKYDGNDVAHVILVKHRAINWRRLLSYFEQHWEVLLSHLIKFRYIYPHERDLVPRWLIDELLSRLADQRKMPVPRLRACRGRIFSRDDFLIDITEWGFADLIGDDKHP
jgi:hypothetical protein